MTRRRLRRSRRARSSSSISTSATSATSAGSWRRRSRKEKTLDQKLHRITAGPARAPCRRASPSELRVAPISRRAPFPPRGKFPSARDKSARIVIGNAENLTQHSHDFIGVRWLHDRRRASSQPRISGATAFLIAFGLRLTVSPSRARARTIVPNQRFIGQIITTFDQERACNFSSPFCFEPEPRGCVVASIAPLL